MPGGAADQDESPLRCALRETREEIGLEGRELRLVGVQHSPSDGIRPDSLKFVFFGDTLSAEEIAGIRLQRDEFEEFRFLPVSEAVPMLSGSLQRCVPACLEAIRSGAVASIQA